MGRNSKKTSRNSTGVKTTSDSRYSVLDSECKRTVIEAEHGNYSKAISMVKNLLSKYENSRHEAYVYETQGNVFTIVSQRIDDLEDSKRYLERAIESAKRAVDLSPNTIQFSLTYATFLYESVNEGWEYDKVMRECERALAVEDVVSPTSDKRPDECSEVEYRVGWIQEQLRFLIQKCNVALFSILMKNLRNEEEKFGFKPIRKFFDRTTTAGKMASMAYSQRLSQVNSSGFVEKRKHGVEKRIVSPDKMMEWVRPCWESMSLDRKKDFLKVKIADLKEYIMSLKNQLPSKVIVEALSFCKEKKEWHFMICCSCNKKISHNEAFEKHIKRVHLQRMPLKQQSVFPKCVNDDWIEMIRGGSWEPLDLNAATKVLEERQLDFVDKESLLHEKWPVAPDSQRAELLGKIQDRLDCLVKLQCLCESHIKSISDYAGTALQNHTQLLALNVYQTHLFICFLGAPELSNILSVLQKIANSCDREYSGASSANIDDSNNLAQDAFMGKIAISQEDSIDVSIYDHSSDNSPETDALLFSLYEKSSNTGELPSCPPFEFLMEEKAQQGLGILQQVEKEFMRLKVSIDLKLNFLGSQDALLVVEKYLCDVVREKIVHETNLDQEIRVSALRNRKEELLKTETTVSDDTLELNAIKYVLDEVESLGSDNVDDSQVREVFRSRGKGLAAKICEMDARIMSTHAKRIHLLQELASVAKHDFRIIITPLLKSFLRSRLTGLKTKTVDELFLDSESNVGSGVDNPKLVSEKAKDSKKESEKKHWSKGLVTNSDNSLDKIDKEIVPPDGQVEDCPISKVVSSNGVDAIPDTDSHNLQLLEEELKRKLKLEADERNLEKALERQRQYEAKQKSIANQHGCSTPAIRQEETEIASEGEQLEQALEDQQQTKDDALQKHPVEQHRDKESSKRNDEFRNIPESSAGSVNTGVILTGSEQQPVCGKEPSHDSEPTTGHDIVDVFHFSAVSGGDDWKVVGKRKKSRKTKPNSGPKVTNCDNMRVETTEEILLSREKCPNTTMTPDTDCHLQSEENERRLQETLEYHRHVEHEAKQKNLANQEGVSSTEIRQEEVEIASEGEQIQKTLEECPKSMDCLIWQKLDHLAKNCPEKNTSQCCLKCGDYGHDMVSCREDYCPNDLKQVKCYVCKKYGHLCCVDYGSPTKVQASCYRCGESGHSGPECCMPKDKFHNTSDGAADNSTDGCTVSNGSVKGAILTNNQQQSAREREPGHDKREPTSRHDSFVDHSILLKKRPETSDAGSEAIIKVNGKDVPERGLRILLVEHNSFPSVIIQSLWHIRRFRDDVQRSSVHTHVDDPFVVCALCDFLVAQNAPDHPLTVAIRKMVSCFFNKGPMDDASEVLGIILTHFHQVLMPSQDVPVTESVESNCHKSSINLFKLDIIESMTCYKCELKSRYRKYTSFFHKINANNLGKVKVSFPTYSFDELLNLVEINHRLACEPEAFGCGTLNHIEHILTSSPHVFTAYIEWQNNSGSCEVITQILEAICTSIDVRLLYRGLNTEHRHHLVFMVCYSGQHYCCFGFNETGGKWIIHDHKTIKIIGAWKDVVAMCKAKRMKPLVLFYEAKY